MVKLVVSWFEPGETGRPWCLFFLSSCFTKFSFSSLLSPPFSVSIPLYFSCVILWGDVSRQSCYYFFILFFYVFFVYIDGLQFMCRQFLREEYTSQSFYTCLHRGETNCLFGVKTVTLRTKELSWNKISTSVSLQNTYRNLTFRKTSPMNMVNVYYYTYRQSRQTYT